MSRIKDAFKNKAFIGFITAGDPSIDKTYEYILKMAEAGVSLIEIGIPFSDPTAEGEVIEKADLRALSNGMKTSMVFDLVKKLRKEIDTPLVFMTYANPVFHYGYDEFFKKCKEVGIDGIIIPDISFEESYEPKNYAKKYGIDFISLIAPTSSNRIKMIAKEAEGFIYLVSSLGTTGVRSEIKTDLKSIVKEIKEVTDVPVAIGFGISKPEQVKEFTKYADGCIVGSRIVRIVEEKGIDAADEIYEYCKSMVNAL